MVVRASSCRGKPHLITISFYQLNVPQLRTTNFVFPSFPHHLPSSQTRGHITPCLSSHLRYANIRHIQTRAVSTLSYADLFVLEGAVGSEVATVLMVSLEDLLLLAIKIRSDEGGGDQCPTSIDSRLDISYVPSFAFF